MPKSAGKEVIAPGLNNGDRLRPRRTDSLVAPDAPYLSSAYYESCAAEDLRIDC